MEYSETIEVLDGFLSKEECEHVMMLSTPKLEASTVWDVKTGEKKQDTYRVSEQAYLPYAATPMIREIEKRIAAIVKLPLENSEALQVVHYNVGGYYKEHWDYFDPAFPGNAEALRRGGQRTLTFMVYLNDVEEGGSTYFPRIDFRGVPKQGRALVWSNIHADGSINPATFHVAEPVVRGEKWIFTKWFRERKFEHYPVI